MIALFPEIISSLNNWNAEKTTLLFRKYFAANQENDPYISMELMFRNFGISYHKLTYAEDNQGLATSLLKDQNGSFTIDVIANKSMKKVERRFLLAHVLGHICDLWLTEIAESKLQRSGFSEIQPAHSRYTSNNYATTDTGNREKERKADEFASFLLMPTKLVLIQWHKHSGNILKMADEFGVPPGTVKRRCAFIKSSRNQNPVKTKPHTPTPPDRLPIMDTKNTQKDIPTKTYKTKQNQEKSLFTSKGLGRIRELAKLIDQNKT